MKRVWMVPALWLVAGGCSDGTAHLPIEGEVKIEVPTPVANEQGAMPEVSVFLGDGKAHLAQVGESNQVTFTDPAISGPQDITVVWSYPASDGSRSSLGVYTVFQVNRREVFLDPYYYVWAESASQAPAARLIARVRGLSQDPDTHVSVRVFNEDRLLGRAEALSLGKPFPDGTLDLTVDLAEKPAGPFSLVAHETDSTGCDLRGAVLAKDLKLEPWGDTRVEVDLAPATLETVSVDVGVGSRKYARASVALNAKDIGALATGETGMLPLEVKAVALEKEWADFSRTVCLQRSDSLGLSIGADSLEGNSARLDLLDIPAIIAPTVVPVFEPVAPTEVSAAEAFTLQWRADPAATAVRVTLAPKTADATLWSFEAPASRTSFSQPAFPEALAHLAPTLVGEYDVTVSSMRNEKISDYSSRFVRRTLENPSCGPLDGGRQAFSYSRGRFTRK